MRRAAPPRWLRWLASWFPADFRIVHGRGPLDHYPGPPDGAGRVARARYWMRAGWDVGASLTGTWWDRALERSDNRRYGSRRAGIMDRLGTDVKQATRGLLRTPGFTLLALLTVGLGLGANTAIFSVVNGVLLTPLPYDGSDRLVRVSSRFLPESGFDFPQFTVDPVEFLDFQAQNRSFSDAAAYVSSGVVLSDEERGAERVQGLFTTWTVFPTLRAQPDLGRALTAEDDRAGGPDRVVISHRLWRDRLGADPEVVGRTIRVNRASYEVVGVMPAGFAFPSPDTDLYMPLQLSETPSNRQSHYLRVIARLRDGVDLESAHTDVAQLMGQWAQEFPDIHTGHFLYLDGYLDDLVNGVRPALLLLLGAVGIVLLVVCANMANLLMARGQGRASERTVRRALGATRWRIVRQSLVESGLIAGLGALVGVALAHVGIRGLLTLQDGSIPRAEGIGIDGNVLLYTGALAVVTTVAFGLLPALHGLRREATTGLREDGRGGTDTRSRLQIRNALVAAEVAVSIVLVIGAALVTQSFRNLLREDPGFRTDGGLVATLSLPGLAYPNFEAPLDFFREVTERTASIPGVEGVTHATHLPLRSGQSNTDFELEGVSPPGPGQPAWNAGNTTVRSNYFELMGIPVLSGRDFDPTLDRPDGAPAVVVSEALVDRFFEGLDPLGMRMRFSGAAPEDPWWTIVGVVGDVDHIGLGNRGSPMYYRMFEQLPLYQAGSGAARFAHVVLRTPLDPMSLTEPFRRIVRELDPELAVTNVEPLEGVVTGSVAQPRFVTTLMTLFAGLALGLGAIGIYGVSSFSVAERRREIGIRKALGAGDGEIASMVLRQGLRPVLGGVAFGVVVALGGGRVVSSLLYGVTPTHGPTYAVVAGALGVVALLSLWAPARRAAGVDPMISMRTE